MSCSTLSPRESSALHALRAVKASELLSIGNDWRCDHPTFRIILSPDAKLISAVPELSSDMFPQLFIKGTCSPIKLIASFMALRAPNETKQMARGLSTKPTQNKNILCYILSYIVTDREGNVQGVLVGRKWHFKIGTYKCTQTWLSEWSENW